MPDLEMLLRDVRPVPEPSFAARLDARVARGFPRPPALWKRPLLAMRDHMLALGTLTAVAGAIVVLVFAGLSSRGSDDESASGGASAPAATPAGAEDSSGAGTAPKTAKVGSLAAPIAPPQDRDVKTTTSVTLTTTPDQVQAVSDRAIRVVDALGGYVESSEIDVAGAHASATLSLRIPAASADDGLARLSKL